MYKKGHAKYEIGSMLRYAVACARKNSYMTAMQA